MIQNDGDEKEYLKKMAEIHLQHFQSYHEAYLKLIEHSDD